MLPVVMMVCVAVCMCMCVFAYICVSVGVVTMLVMTGRLIRMETRELLHEEGVEDPWDKVALALVACG